MRVAIFCEDLTTREIIAQSDDYFIFESQNFRASLFLIRADSFFLASPGRFPEPVVLRAHRLVKLQTKFARQIERLNKLLNIGDVFDAVFGAQTGSEFQLDEIGEIYDFDAIGSLRYTTGIGE